MISYYLKRAEAKNGMYVKRRERPQRIMRKTSADAKLENEQNPTKWPWAETPDDMDDYGQPPYSNMLLGKLKQASACFLTPTQVQGKGGGGFILPQAGMYCMYVFTDIGIDVYIYMHIYIYLSIYIYICIYICIYIYIYINYIYVYIHVCMRIHKHTDRRYTNIYVYAHVYMHMRIQVVLAQVHF